MTPESIQAMIDQALLRNSTNGDGSHSSHGDNRRNVQTARPCFYADFMKCQPLNFKGTEGVAIDLMDQKRPQPDAEGNLTTRGRLMIHPENNQGHQQQPSREQNVAKGLQYGDLERSLWGSLPKCTKFHLHHNGLYTQSSKEMVGLECVSPGHFSRIVRKLEEQKMEEKRKMHKAGFYAVWNA
ncbi:hypothetical protein Tco_0839338 [Tanacetum coccineum]|uniref:Uncharacterized protein n=1 Tax=Tanacetum coccineum TaxID=301880 RepID=A0ABQ5AU96_9ASTR